MTYLYFILILGDWIAIRYKIIAKYSYLDDVSVYKASILYTIIINNVMSLPWLFEGPNLLNFKFGIELLMATKAIFLVNLLVI